MIPQNPSIIAVLISWSALATAQLRGEVTRSRNLAEQGWDLVKGAGPGAAGYSDGVEQAYAALIGVSGTLRAESVYEEALKATEAASFQSIRLQILVRLAFRLSQGQEVKARRPNYYGHLLIRMAELQEKMGSPEEAEKLRRRAANEPAFEPLPYPLIGLREDPREIPQVSLAPDIKMLVYEAEEQSGTEPSCEEI